VVLAGEKISPISGIKMMDIQTQSFLLSA